jgi:hypothetical protein
MISVVYLTLVLIVILALVSQFQIWWIVYPTTFLQRIFPASCRPVNAQGLYPNIFCNQFLSRQALGRPSAPLTQPLRKPAGGLRYRLFEPRKNDDRFRAKRTIFLAEISSLNVIGDRCRFNLQRRCCACRHERGKRVPAEEGQSSSAVAWREDGLSHIEAFHGNAPTASTGDPVDRAKASEQGAGI